MKDPFLFGNFRSGPARDVMRKLGLPEFLEVSISWNDFRESLRNYERNTHGGLTGRVARGSLDGDERALALAIIAFAGFELAADTIDTGSHGMTWRRVMAASAKYRDAIAACIMAGE